MSFEIIKYQSKWLEAWEEFCDRSRNSTFLHTRKFLNYHKAKFVDESLIVMKSGKIHGLLPAARDNTNPSVIISHPGATFGGLLTDGSLQGDGVIKVFEETLNFYKLLGFEKFVYKSVPFIYHTQPFQDDVYALFRLGAKKTASELTSVIDLQEQNFQSTRKKRNLKKAANIVEVSNDQSLLSDLYQIIEFNLKNRYQVEPVHSLGELEYLKKIFPERIIIRTGIIKGSVVAGIVLFNSKKVWHTQYVASDEIGRDFSAVDVVINSAIDEGKIRGNKYFDFGKSTEKNGQYLNSGLYKFKNEFGGGGISYETYEIPLI